MILNLQQPNVIFSLEGTKICNELANFNKVIFQGDTKVIVKVINCEDERFVMVWAYYYKSKTYVINNIMMDIFVC